MWQCWHPCTLIIQNINNPCSPWHRHKHTYTEKKTKKTIATLGSFSAWAQCKLSAQIAFLELIISFYVIHLSVVIVCQSNAVAPWYEVDSKFCLGNSSLCTKRGWPRSRIYIYNYSHDTIISHHNSSAQDVSTDREQAFHAAYQTAVWQAWHHTSRTVICTMQSVPPLLSVSVLFSFCIHLILNVCPF